MALNLRRVYSAPDNFSQLFDNVFHLSLVRYFAETGTGSSISRNGMDAGDSLWFYPAAFHDVASLVLLAFPQSIALALTATVWAMLAVAWPLGCIYLVSRLRDLTPCGAVGTGVVAVGLPGFPFLLLTWGILYPNMLGLVLLPVGIGLTVEALGLGREKRFDLLAVLAGALVLPGLALAHPSALLSLMAVATPALLAKTAQVSAAARSGATRGKAWVFQAVAMLALLPAFAVVWWKARPIEAPWDPPLSRFEAFGQAVLQAPFTLGPAWLLSILAFVGLLACLRTQWWLVAAWGLSVALWLFAASGPTGNLRDLLTGVYYNDPYRLGALMAVVALPVVAVGWDTTVSWLGRWFARMLPRISPKIVLTATGITALAALVALTQTTGYLRAMLDKANHSHELAEWSWMITKDELTLIERLPQHVEPGSVIATNPWNGSSLAYAFTGLPTTTRHVFYPSTEDLDTLQNSMDDAASDPTVCPAVRDLDVDYVLDFGTATFTADNHNPFDGFRDFVTAAGFELVDREGDASLYRVTACG